MWPARMAAAAAADGESLPASGTWLLTPYGWGVLSREESTAERLVVSVWQEGGGGATVYLNPEEVRRCAVAPEGACLLTTYGVGVLLRYERDRDVYVVRLWRPRGTGSAEAFLGADTILREVPACPGFTITTPYGEGRALCFDAQRDMYTVELSYGTAHMHASAVSCPRAKLLPAIAFLAARSRAYWRTQWSLFSSADTDAHVQDTLQALGNTKTVEAVSEESVRLGTRLSRLVTANDDIAEVGAAGERIVGELWNPQTKSGQKTAALLEGARGRLLRRFAQLSTEGTVEEEKRERRSATAADQSSKEQQLSDGLNCMMVTLLEKWTDAAQPTDAAEQQTQKQQQQNQQQQHQTVEDKVAQLTEVLQAVSDSGPQDAIAQAKERAQTTARRWGAQTSERLEAAMLQMISQEEARNGYRLTGVDLLDRFKSGKSVYRSVVSPWVLKAKATLKQVSGDEQADLWDELSAPLEDVFARIADGSFTWETAVSSTASSLDADNFADVARGWMVEGENVMSTLEQWGASPSLKHTIRTLKDMDIEKRLMSGIEDLDMEYVLESAESAMVDADARARLVNDTKDTVLEFLLEHLPAINVPDIDGVKDDVEYHIGSLDMSGFRMRKEDVVVVLGSSLEDEVLSVSATNIGAQFKQLSWGYKQLYFPYMYGEGIANATVQSASVKLGFRMTRVSVFDDDDTNTEDDTARDHDGSGISENAGDTKSEGQHARTASGQRGNPDGEGGVDDTGRTRTMRKQFRPALTVSSIEIAMEDLTLAIDDTSLAWLYNLLASVFAYAIKDYVCDTLKAAVEEHVGTLVGAVNAYAEEYWPYLLSMLDVSVEDLPIASEEERRMVKQGSELWEAHYQDLMASMQNRDVALVFTQEGSLGLQLEAHQKKCQLRIRGVNAESQAEQILQQRGLLRHIAGAEVVSVEDVRLLPTISVPVTSSEAEAPQQEEAGQGVGGSEAYEHALEVVQSGKRPMHMTLRLSEQAFATMSEDRLRMVERKAVANVQIGSAEQANAVARRRELQLLEHEFGEGQLGMKLRQNRSCGGAMIVTGFVRGPNDEMLQAEACGKVRVGMIVARIGNEIVFGRPFDESLRLLQQAARPVTLSFSRTPDCMVKLSEFPEDLILGAIRGHIMVTGFRHVDGPARRSGEICPGMVLLQAGSSTVPRECSPEDCFELIRNSREDSGTDDANAVRYRLFFRDMDAFVKLIKLRELATTSAARPVQKE